MFDRVSPSIAMDQLIRQKIWFEIEETERTIRYCSPLKDRFIKEKSNLERRQLIFAASLFILTPTIYHLEVNSTIFLSLFAFQLVLLAGLFHSVVAERYRKLHTTIDVLESVIEKYQEVSTEMLSLWDRCELDKVSPESADLLIEQLSKRCDMLDSLTKGFDLTVDEQLNRQSAEDAKIYMEGTVAKVHAVNA